MLQQESFSAGSVSIVHVHARLARANAPQTRLMTFEPDSYGGNFKKYTHGIPLYKSSSLLGRSIEHR